MKVGASNLTKRTSS